MRTFMGWTDKVCDKYIPKGVWNLVCQFGVMIAVLSTALIIRNL